MNYRHAYHAGNFADVLKHTVLLTLIEALKAKPTPFTLIETHAGSGCYNRCGRSGVSKIGRDHGGVFDLGCQRIGLLERTVAMN